MFNKHTFNWVFQFNLESNKLETERLSSNKSFQFFSNHDLHTQTSFAAVCWGKRQKRMNIF